MSDTTVRFLAVGKVSSKLLVASLVNKDVPGMDLHKLAGKMMRSSKVSRAVPPADFRVALPGNAGYFVDMHIDGDDHCFMSITPPDYPRRLITAAGDDTPCLMNEFRRDFMDKLEDRFRAARLEDELFKPANRVLRALVTKYSNVQSLDKIRQLQARVEDVQMIMHENLSKAVDRGERLDVVAGKTETLADSSDLFHKRATKTARFMQCRYYKMIALVLCIIVTIILFLVLIFELS